MKDKEGFLLYKGMYKPIECLTLEQRGMLLTAIYEYQIYGEAPEIQDGMTHMAFRFFLNQFRIDEESNEDTGGDTDGAL